MTEDLSPDELGRYARHIILPQVGTEGQKLIRDSSVCVIGAGGLGSPVILYLAAAGLGRIGIVDDDVVDITNLQRQILHGTPQVGLPKVASAQARVESLNPMVKVESHQVRLGVDNALDILGGYDIVIDGTDNLPTRYLINDACEMLGIPWIYGSIYRFEGQCSVFNHEGGPSYRDLFPEAPPADLIPSCSEGGVLGVLPGVIGTIQANEALKIVLGIGQPISGILMIFDALELRFRGLRIKADPGRPKITELVAVEPACEVGSGGHVDGPQPVQEGVMVNDIGCVEASQRMQEGWSPFVIDVRSLGEASIASLPFADTLVPHVQIDEVVEDLPAEGDILLHCHHGVRSMIAATMLAALGVDPSRLFNLNGGIDAWSQLIDDSIPRY